MHSSFVSFFNALQYASILSTKFLGGRSSLSDPPEKVGNFMVRVPASITVGCGVAIVIILSRWLRGVLS